MIEVILNPFGAKTQEIPSDFFEIVGLSLLGFRIELFHMKDQIQKNQHGDDICVNMFCVNVCTPWKCKLMWFLY